MTDIREKTCIIIRKNGLYLQGKNWLSDELKWTWSVYDAWRTRDREKARDVARATGGITMLFNPIARQLRVI